MPWKESCHVDERMKFVARLKDGERMVDLCREFGISRKTGYKFLGRYEELSVVGLKDQPRRPERIPHKVAGELAELLLATRGEHPTWGPRKIRAYLSRRKPGLGLPAPSTIGNLLARNGLVVPRRNRRKSPVEYSPVCHALAPNDVWSVDFKGQFRMRNGKYCYPLTVSDAFSRYILLIEALESTLERTARIGFERCFQEYGLPSAIRSDNGTPFASRAIAGLSRLSVWWLRLGIALERIEPANPQQNGRHERMHRTLKAETTRPAGKNLLQQQERFDRFRDIYNRERPHEALEQRPPGELYVPSTRRLPKSPPEPDYPLHDVTARVQSEGHIQIPGTGRKVGHIFVSQALAGEIVGLRELDDDLWLISFLHLDLGVIDTRTRRLTPGTPAPKSAPDQADPAPSGSGADQADEQSYPTA